MHKFIRSLSQRLKCISGLVFCIRFLAHTSASRRSVNAEKAGNVGERVGAGGVVVGNCAVTSAGMPFDQFQAMRRAELFWHLRTDWLTSELAEKSFHETPPLEPPLGALRRTDRRHQRHWYRITRSRNALNRGQREPAVYSSQ